MTQLTSGRNFSLPLAPHADNVEEAFTNWVSQVRGADLPHLCASARGLEQDREAVNAALTLPYSNGLTEGVNTQTKWIARQMHEGAGFLLFRPRSLFG